MTLPVILGTKITLPKATVIILADDPEIVSISGGRVDDPPLRYGFMLTWKVSLRYCNSSTMASTCILKREEM